MFEPFTLEAASVIPRFDRGIQSFQQVLDCPVKPDNDMLTKHLIIKVLTS